MPSCETSDVSIYRKSMMAAGIAEAAITFERLEIGLTLRIQLLPPTFATRPDFDMTLPIARHFVTSAVDRIQNGGHRSGNNY